jgi:antitoxin ParD1/3/4
MNVKNTITLSDRYMRRAEQMVEDGQFPSIEKVVEAGIDELLRSDDLTPEQNDAVTGMADEIRRRMELPRDQWIPMDQDTMFSDLKEHIRKKMEEPQNGL